jgi:phosphate starvation-inducible membrane PsiE
LEDNRKKAVNYLSIAVWAMVALFLTCLTFFIAVDLFNAYRESNFGLKKIGIFFLNIELLIMSLKAVREGGHFPRRDLPVFLATVLVFGVAIYKTSMTPLMIFTLVVSIVILLLLAQILRITNNKYKLKH